ncbi:MAG: hypothetical protein ACPGTP_04925 [Bacteroidia bacterium]
MKYIVTLMLSIISITKVLACDVCAGGGGMSSLGFLPNSNFHFVGLTYKLKTYDTKHPLLFESDQQIEGKNVFHTTEVFGRYIVSDKIQILAFIPFHSKTIDDTELEELQINNGLGDISLLANYQIKKSSKLKWFAGIGVKLPTGKSDNLINDDLMPNMQLGSGSTDLIVSSNMTYVKDKVGVNTELNYVYTTANKAEYKFGNQAEITSMAFYKVKKSGRLIIPQAGINYQYAAKDYIDYSRLKIEKYSGSSYFNGSLGLDFYTGKNAIRLKYNIPLSGTMTEGYITPKVNGQIQYIRLIKKTTKNKNNK